MGNTDRLLHLHYLGNITDVLGFLSLYALEKYEITEQGMSTEPMKVTGLNSKTKISYWEYVFA